MKPRVLFALGASPDKIGGMETFGTELARGLEAKGWDLTMVFQDVPPAAVREYLLSPGNVTLDVLREQTAMGLRSNLAFVRMLLRHKPTVVIYTYGGIVRWWALLGFFFGVKRTIFYDGNSRTAAAMGYRSSLKVRLVMSPLHAVVCATNFIASCVESEGIVPMRKCRMVYSAVETGRDRGDAQLFRGKYGIPEDAILLLKVSWLVPDKGVDVALRGLWHALKVRRDLHLLVCGDGAYRAEYERLALDLGISDHVTWTGQVQKLFGSGAFAAADVQIQCSQWHEAFCLAVAEGMSAGLPVVASRIGGLPELVKDGTTGFLFAPSSDQELSEKILLLAGDEGLRRKMGEAGCAAVRARHDLRSNIATWVDMVTCGKELPAAGHLKQSAGDLSKATWH